MSDFTTEDTFTIEVDEYHLYASLEVLAEVSFEEADMSVGDYGGAYVKIKNTKVGSLLLTREDLVAMIGEKSVKEHEGYLSETVCKADYL